MALLQTYVPEAKKYTTKEEGERIEKVFRSNTKGLLTLDEQIYVPMFGFKDRFEYYRAATLSGKLIGVAVPTFSLSALDDQICPNKYNPNKEVSSPDSNVIIGTTDYGNHCTHIGGNWLPKQWWIEPIMEFLEFHEA